MRLSMNVNGSTPIVASVPGAGYLSAHLNMKNRPKENESGISVTISGTETKETETVRLKWPILDLKVGDAVELRVLPEGQGDAPTSVRRSSESPYNLLSSPELARELLNVISEFEQRLTDLRLKSQDTEPPDEYKKFESALATVAWELGQNLLYPVYRRHKELIPDELKGESL
jgi:hypothetical protein